ECFCRSGGKGGRCGASAGVLDFNQGVAGSRGSSGRVEGRRRGRPIHRQAEATCAGGAVVQQNIIEGVAGAGAGPFVNAGRGGGKAAIIRFIDRCPIRTDNEIVVGIVGAKGNDLGRGRSRGRLAGELIDADAGSAGGGGEPKSTVEDATAAEIG